MSDEYIDAVDKAWLEERARAETEEEKEQQWTTEFPTKPGFYWVRNLEFKYSPDAPVVSEPDAQIVRIYDDFEIGFVADEVTIVFGQIVTAEWQGPIHPQP